MKKGQLICKIKEKQHSNGLNIPINLGNSPNLQGTAINSVPLILTWQGEKFHMIDVMLFLCLKGLPIF